MNVRVRGIYATAITKILIDEGFNITHASQIIKERFNIKDDVIAPDVTVKDVDGKYGIVVIGKYNVGKKVFDVLRQKIGTVYVWESKLPLHAIYKGVVKEKNNGKCIVDINGVRGILNCNAEPGSEVVVEISKPVLPPSNEVLLSTNYTIYGNYVALIYGLKGRVIFSRHITNPEIKRNLRMIVSLMKISGDWGVKWRSSAILGRVNDLMLDLQQTFEKANKFLDHIKEAPVGKFISEGQFFGILGFDSKARCILDDYRNNVVPTIRYHHALKSMDNNLTQIIDYTEYLMKIGTLSRELATQSIFSYIEDLLSEKKLINIEHISLLKGEIIKLTPGHLHKVCKQGDIIHGVLKRVFKGGGYLDGLNVPKEYGDYDLMEFSTSAPIILHKYHSKDGIFKGLYININSYPELSPGILRYIDLEIDVIVRPNGEVHIIDSEKLKIAYEEKILSKEKYDTIQTIVGSIESVLKREFDYNQLKNISIKDLEEKIQLNRYCI